MTTPTTRGATFLHAARRLAAHLAGHQLPEPESLTVMTSARRSRVTVQVASDTVPSVAAELLAWAQTLPMVTVGAWRVLAGDRVHLSIASTLTSPASAVELDVYGGVDHDSALLADLAPGERRDVSLGQLRTWVAGAADTAEGGGVA